LRTYTRPLLLCTSSLDINNDESTSAGNDNDKDDDDDDDDINDDSFQNHLRRYVVNFRLLDYRDDILIELSKYPDSVGIFHKQLVTTAIDDDDRNSTKMKPKMKQTDFWCRYFYRCNEKVVLNDLRRRQRRRNDKLRRAGNGTRTTTRT
jgi:hypothetical protein